MATAMEIAMAEAARKVQQSTTQTKPMSMKQKIWRWIKDHPNCTNKAIAEAFNTTAANAAGTTSNLLARDMIIVTGKVPSIPIKAGRWIPPEANRFSVNPKMRGVYEQLPFIKGANAGMPIRKRRVEKAPEASPPVQESAPAPTPVAEKPLKEPVQVPAFDPEKIVNDLTFGEAMSLFRYLCKHLKVEP